jgi:adenylate cyclase
MKIHLRTKYIVGEVLLFTALWIVITQIYYHIAIPGYEGILKETDFWHIFSQVYNIDDIILSGIVFGVIFSFINILFDRTKFRKLPLGRIIIFKTLLYVLANALTDVLIFTLNTGARPDIFLLATLQSTRELLPTSFIIATISYYLLFILLLNFLYQIIKKIGPRILLNSILGKYRKPRNEKLIFMFLDMKNSTRIAEMLEHKKYSLFVKDCFSRLTNPIYNCDADIYQYVGDEAVLIWPLNKGIRNLNCLRLFFEFRKALLAGRDYFLETYGVFPEFKAGVDFGEITVTEVGEIRRDLAYHGDVLNTAARLEKLCKSVGKDLLISEYLNDEIKDLPGFRRELINEFLLEGKNNRIKVYSISQDYLPATYSSV